jgi:hypothetical protein
MVIMPCSAHHELIILPERRLTLDVLPCLQGIARLAVPDRRPNAMPACSAVLIIELIDDNRKSAREAVRGRRKVNSGIVSDFRFPDDIAGSQKSRSRILCSGSMFFSTLAECLSLALEGLTADLLLKPDRTAEPSPSEFRSRKEGTSLLPQQPPDPRPSLSGAIWCFSSGE